MRLKTGLNLRLTRKKQTHKRRGKGFWIKTINDFERSSLSLHDFCGERGLATSTFHGWRQQLRSIGALPQKGVAIPPKKAPLFLPVYGVSSKAVLEKTKQSDSSFLPQPSPKKCTENPSDHLPESSSGLSLHLNEHLKVSIQKDFDELTLQRLVDLFSHIKPERGSESC